VSDTSAPHWTCARCEQLAHGHAVTFEKHHRECPKHGLEELAEGICDGCGKTQPRLYVINGAPAAGVCLCDSCLGGK
jgi:hypothetical protein